MSDLKRTEHEDRYGVCSYTYDADEVDAEITSLKAELETWIGRTEDLLTMAKSGLYGAGNIWSEAGNWFDKHGKAIRQQENEDG